MTMHIHVDIVSAEESVFSGLAEMVIAPAEEGEVGIAARHAPLLTRLKAGEVQVKISESERFFFFVAGGIIEVQPDLVSILADRAIRAKDIDEASAQEAKRKAEEALKDKDSKLEYAKAISMLAEAMAELRTLDSYRKKN
ncbi:F0F1 ATP synthase subunit epsilon [Candidatus Methylospira mobilis]|uniref:ATP synthase epsilon chain n=1 Tax=Candidatus Methylospira mobilis TaxID=1808979 RepID=A0A5Q0BKY8_9GAMM|nr:F0F1 ATP synthase subunit epsilon [Candidatus Methylospira mobilis]QFY44595.1 F0F1 ATP synthase subunit epsilon [Candidatus Methylospira mobilis]WNV05969.1 F0F1 ATP synthase subunit epsilon [Candidatus Methylospira mobilis]